MPKPNQILTQRMKMFCYAYARTGNATQSYLEAYGTDNTKNATRAASNLLQRNDVTAFLKDINQSTVNLITNEREKKRKIIWDRIEICLEKGDETAIARYMDILNKMDAEYVNINRNIDDSAERLSTLTNDQLKELVGEPAEK